METDTGLKKTLSTEKTTDPLTNRGGMKMDIFSFNSAHGDLYPRIDYEESDTLFRALFRYYLEGNEYSDRYLFGHLQTADRTIDENLNFDYPVIRPAGQGRFNGVTILFHGLNEKRWDKYLPWAEKLCEFTGQPVLLYPMAFHMNRAPAAWSEPRKMIPVSRERTRLFPDLEGGSFVNVALSHRIQFAPHRFLTSGLHSFLDARDLIRTIRSGEHPLFSPGASVNLFGYSIGATIVEFLMMADPENLLSDAGGFLFCGGSTLDRATPVNRTIIDREAHRELLSFFHQLVENSPSPNTHLHDLAGTYLRELEWFKSLLFLDRMRSRRERRFEAISHRLRGAVMARDLVFSPDTVSATLRGRDNTVPVDLQVFDPPFRYSHENPIPLRRTSDGQESSPKRRAHATAEAEAKDKAEEFLDTLMRQAADFFQTI